MHLPCKAELVDDPGDVSVSVCICLKERAAEDKGQQPLFCAAACVSPASALQQTGRAACLPDTLPPKHSAWLPV